MVVCKCRKATKLYCFVHRTPVCLDCICATEHEHCVVWQYSDWVNDGDYDWPPLCSVCQESLEDSDKATVRLGCLHVPHSQCLQQHLENFPAHTAPAGFTCPAPGCQAAVWPPRSQKDASSTLFTKLRALISASKVAESLLMAPIPGLATPPVVSREQSSSDLASVSAAAGAAAAGAGAGPGAGASGASLSGQAAGGGGSMPGIQSQGAHLEQQPTLATGNDSGKGLNGPGSLAKPESVASPPQVLSPHMATARSRGSGHGAVAVDIQEDLSKDTSHGYAADEDEGERKYARRGPAHVHFLRSLGSLWSPALQALPVSNPNANAKKEKEDAEEGGDHRLRRARSNRGAMDPRKLLLGLAIGSCMATMLLLYYRLAQGGLSSGDIRLP